MTIAVNIVILYNNNIITIVFINSTKSRTRKYAYAVYSIKKIITSLACDCDSWSRKLHVMLDFTVYRRRLNIPCVRKQALKNKSPANVLY